MKSLSEIFAENLKFYRKKAGLTQKALSQRLGYTEKAVSKWESGLTIPPAESLVKLAEALHTGLDGLLSYQKAPEYFLGIDGGATKTMFALADSEGNVIRHLCLGPCNPVDIGFEKVENLLTDGIREITNDIACSEISLYAGLSGGNVGNNEAIFMEFFKRFRFSRIGIGNDAMNIVSAGLDKFDGIAIIMGTGSVAFSQKNGVCKQYGGFGYLFDDGGDGYNLGRDAIHAALYDETGGGRRTLITKLLHDINGKSSNDMLSEYYAKGKRFIASYAKAVFAAYDKGDTVAREIIHQNMGEVANLINTAIMDFEKEDLPVKVVFVGGLSKRSDVLFRHIREQLKNKNDVNLCVYPYEPVLGALRLAGATIDTNKEHNITR